MSKFAIALLVMAALAAAVYLFAQGQWCGGVCMSFLVFFGVVATIAE